MPNLRDELNSILHKHINAAVNESIAAYKSTISAGLDGGGHHAAAAKPAAAPAKGRGKRPGVGKKLSALFKGRVCPVPGCGKLGKGPRFRFFCDDHKGLSKAEQDKIIAESKGAAAAPAKGKPAKKSRKKRGKKAAK